MTRLAITCGDPAGIGPEVIGRWIAMAPELGREVVVIGPRQWLATLSLRDDQRIEVGAGCGPAVPGQPDEAGARVAWDAMERAAAG
ncbi:MAG TPA: 4-hydroxythreonine-4-phosphate dehydrogenase, partial [Opitutaceae bacterium]|nr:4-hydroxythreonine-4-phosphate dehydrogenase [Opitutaceae bacterium]